jgi:hypothetical protein
MISQQKQLLDRYVNFCVVAQLGHRLSLAEGPFSRQSRRKDAYLRTAEMDRQETIAIQQIVRRGIFNL